MIPRATHWTSLMRISLPPAGSILKRPSFVLTPSPILFHRTPVWIPFILLWTLPIMAAGPTFAGDSLHRYPMGWAATDSSACNTVIICTLKDVEVRDFTFGDTYHPCAVFDTEIQQVIFSTSPPEAIQIISGNTFYKDPETGKILAVDVPSTPWLKVGDTVLVSLRKFHQQVSPGGTVLYAPEFVRFLQSRNGQDPRLLRQLSATPTSSDGWVPRSSRRPPTSIPSLDLGWQYLDRRFKDEEMSLQELIADIQTFYKNTCH